LAIAVFFIAAALAVAGGIGVITFRQPMTLRLRAGIVDVTLRYTLTPGPAAGVVDNKICSVSDTLSGIRFVIRKADRVYS